MNSTIPSNQTDYLANQYNATVCDESILFISDRGGCACTSITPSVPTELQVDNQDQVVLLDADGSVDGYLQIFKASADNIQSVSMAISGNTAGNSIIDSFADYTSTEDLLNTYSYDGDWHFEPYLGTSGSSQWMEMYMDRRGDGMSVYRDLSDAPKDISGFSAISVDYQTGIAGTRNIVRLVISDGINDAYSQLSVSKTWRWETKELQISAFKNIGMVDTTHITYMGILAYNSRDSTTLLFKDLVLTGGSADNVTTVSIYDFGPISNPATLGTKLDNSEHLIQVNPTKTLENYKIDIKGLVIGEYYGIYVEKPDTGTITLYGTLDKTYNSGRTYTVVADTITAQASSMAFMIKSNTPARLSELHIIPNADTKRGKLVVFSRRLPNNTSQFYLEKEITSGSVSLLLKDTYPEEVILDNNHELVIQYSDTLDSEATELIIQAKYYYFSITTNG